MKNEEKTHKKLVNLSQPFKRNLFQLSLLVFFAYVYSSSSNSISILLIGIIVGPSKTYGKGLVQKITPLPYDNALKYTIAKYYTPSGRCIQSVTYTGTYKSKTK